MKHDELDINQLMNDIKNNSQRKKILLGLFVTGLVLFAVLIWCSPTFTQQEKDKLFVIPKSPEDLRQIYEVLNKYSQQNKFYILIFFIYLYIFLQSFAIPGPVFLSILSGALFGAIPGFLLVCFCATTGASFCYGLSYTLGRGLVLKHFPNLLISFNKKIQANKSNLFYYMLFLRLTPLVPNWFVNISSPIVGIPIKYFSLGTLIGLIPLNLVHLKAGLTLQSLQTIGASFENILWIGLLSIVVLIPTFLKKKAEDFDKKLLEKHEQKAGTTGSTKID